MRRNINILIIKLEQPFNSNRRPHHWCLIMMMKSWMGIWCTLDHSIETIARTNTIIIHMKCYNSIIYSFEKNIIPIMIISGVMNSPDGTVRFDERISTLDYIPISGFPLFLVITGMMVLYSIIKFVCGMSL